MKGVWSFIRRADGGPLAWVSDNAGRLLEVGLSGLQAAAPTGPIETAGNRDEVHLHWLARSWQLGIDEIRAANRHHRSGQLVLPTEWVIPDRPAGNGPAVVVDLPAYRLYYYDGKGHATTMPLGIVRPGWKTAPPGRHAVLGKKAHPWWIPPPDIIRSAARRGIHLKGAYRPGPTNPMGEYEMRVYGEIYLHGTPAFRTVGARASHGCVHMYQFDAEWLFHHIEVGTPVWFEDRPDLVGARNGIVYLQAFRPLKLRGYPNQTEPREAVQAVERWLRRHPGYSIDWHRVKAVATRAHTIPSPVGRRIQKNGSISPRWCTPSELGGTGLPVCESFTVAKQHRHPVGIGN